MGAVIAITFIVACVITLATTALITYIITSYKHSHDHDPKVKVKVDDNRCISLKKKGPSKNKDDDPIYETVTPVISVDNPNYATVNIKMDANPSYA